jgi:hypothetical protein
MTSHAERGTQPPPARLHAKVLHGAGRKPFMLGLDLKEPA